MDYQNKKYLYVVEGNTDEDKLKKLGVTYVVKTGGKYIRSEIHQFLKEVHSIREIILLTDPDGPGKWINTLIKKEISECIELHADKKKAISKNKVGIAEMKIEDIKQLILPYLEHDNQINETLLITKEDFINLGLMGPNGKKKRMALIEKYHMPFTSAKNVLTAIWMLNLTKEEVEEIVNHE